MKLVMIVGAMMGFAIKVGVIFLITFCMVAALSAWSGDVSFATAVATNAEYWGMYLFISFIGAANGGSSGSAYDDDAPTHSAVTGLPMLGGLDSNGDSATI